MTGARMLRYTLGATGLAALAYGANLLVTDPQIAGWTGVLEWLAYALLLHDGVLVPTVMLLGLALGTRLRGWLRWPFVVAGALTAIALPYLLRPSGRANPSVLPLDYGRGWAIAVGTVVALAVCWAAGKWIRGRGVVRGRGRGPRKD